MGKHRVLSAVSAALACLAAGAAEPVAAEELRNSVGIRPTLKKNQGELVSIFIARDLDFSPVYTVSTAPRGGAGAR